MYADYEAIAKRRLELIPQDLPPFEAMPELAQRTGAECRQHCSICPVPVGELCGKSCAAVRLEYDKAANDGITVT